METGISTACFYPLKTEDAIDVINELGFHKIEFFINSEYEYSPQYIIEQRNKLDRLNMSVVSVHSYSVAFEHYLLFSDYSRRSKEGLRIFSDVLNAASILGAKYLTFHGITSFMSSVTDRECLKIYRDLINLAQKHQIIIAQENVSYCRSSDPEFLNLLKNEFGPDELMFTLDIKQARRANTDIDLYLDVIGDRIANVHLNDNDEQQVCLLPGEGKFRYVPFLKKMKLFKYQGDFIIEVYRFNFEELKMVKKSKYFFDSLLSENYKIR